MLQNQWKAHKNPTLLAVGVWDCLAQVADIQIQLRAHESASLHLAASLDDSVSSAELCPDYRLTINQNECCYFKPLSFGLACYTLDNHCLKVVHQIIIFKRLFAPMSSIPQGLLCNHPHILPRPSVLCWGYHYMDCSSRTGMLGEHPQAARRELLGFNLGVARPGSLCRTFTSFLLCSKETSFLNAHLSYARSNFPQKRTITVQDPGIKGVKPLFAFAVIWIFTDVLMETKRGNSRQLIQKFSLNFFWDADALPKQQPDTTAKPPSTPALSSVAQLPCSRTPRCDDSMKIMTASIFSGVNCSFKAPSTREKEITMNTKILLYIGFCRSHSSPTFLQSWCHQAESERSLRLK